MIAGGETDAAVRTAVVTRLGFVPDAFQRKAFDALDAGQSVLVSAPTGSGKTAVADYAVARALASGRKAFYTTPLKALSNQKFAELPPLTARSASACSPGTCRTDPMPTSSS